MSSVSNRSARLPFSIRPAVLALALPLAMVCHTAYAEETSVTFAGTVSQDAAGNTTAVLTGAGSNLSFTTAGDHTLGSANSTITLETDATAAPVQNKVYGLNADAAGNGYAWQYLTVQGSSVNIDTKAAFNSTGFHGDITQAAGIVVDSGNDGNIYLDFVNGDGDGNSTPVGALNIRTETTGLPGSNFTDAHTRSTTYGIVTRGVWGNFFSQLNTADITVISNVSGWAQGVAQEGAGQFHLNTEESLRITAVGDVRSTAVFADAYQHDDGSVFGGALYLYSNGTMDISATSKTETARAHGVVALGGAQIWLNADDDLTLTVENMLDGVTAGVLSIFDNSQVSINTGSALSISAKTAGQLASALEANGGRINVSARSEEKTSSISGHVLAANDGSVTIDLGRGNITGRMDNFDADAADTRQYRTNHPNASYVGATGGSITLNLGEGSVWNMTGDSFLSGLNANGSTFRLNDTTVDSDYRTLTTRGFYGSDNTFVMRAALTEENASNLALDQLVLKDRVLPPGFEFEVPMLMSIYEEVTPPEIEVLPPGVLPPGGLYPDMNHKNKVLLVLDSAPAADDTKVVAVNPTVINQSGIEYDFETLGGYVDGSTDRWVLRFAADEADLNTADPAADLGTSGTQGAWYLVRTRAESTPETGVVDSVATSKGSYLTWRKELEILRDRLGEVRDGGLDGGWVKLDLDKARTSAAAGHSFKSRDVSLSMGADRRVYQTPTDKVLAGGAFVMGNTDFKAEYARGDMHHFSFKSYATWLRDNGGYVDGVLQTGIYKNSLKGRSNSGLQNATGNYTTAGFGASLEAGHKFAFGKSAGANWFVEPQTQLSYFFLKGNDYTLSTGMKVSQSNAHYLTGRAGGTFGYESAQGIAGTPDFSRTQFAVRTGVNHDFAGKQTIETGDIKNSLDSTGTSFYYGIEANYRKGPTNFFINVERETGNRFSRDISITAGLRVSI